MSTLGEPVFRRSSGVAVALFVGLALGLSGLYWVLFALRARGWVPFDPSSDLLGAARGYTPALAAMVTTLALGGREGNYSVYLLVTLFPALEEAPATEATYVAVVAVAALFAAAAMRRETAGAVANRETGSGRRVAR